MRRLDLKRRSITHYYITALYNLVSLRRHYPNQVACSWQVLGRNLFKQLHTKTAASCDIAPGSLSADFISSPFITKLVYHFFSFLSIAYGKKFSILIYAKFQKIMPNICLILQLIFENECSIMNLKQTF